jgi:sodium-dependent dicarboxylate transporter 2/3/5
MTDTPTTPTPPQDAIPLAPPQNQTPSWLRSLATVLLTVALSVVVYGLLPHDMGELGRRAVAIAVFAAILWATEAIPLYATSLCVIAIEILLLANKGGLAGQGDLSHTQFFAPFASGTIILFLGGFLLAGAITRYELDRAIASRLLRPFMEKSRTLIMAVILTTGFLSVWISNTATAAMMLAILSTLVRDKSANPRLIAALVLAVAFGASIGGISTPVSTPPNAIAMSQLRAKGIEIDFANWVVMAVPLAFIMLVGTGLLLNAMLRPPPLTGLPPIEPPKKISRQGWVTLIVMLCTVLAWFTGPWHKVDDAAIALISAAVLTALGILNRKDIQNVDWDILFLMWGGLALGNALQLTNVLQYVSGLDFFNHSGWVLALLLIVAGMVFATFMSNTAAANLLVPLAIALSADDMGRLGVIVALTVSFSVAMPISTPPNAMAFATGRVSAGQMIMVGSVVSLLAIVMMMIGYFWIVPWVLGI